MLFLKRVSDYWDWEYARALDAFDGDEELARLDDNFRFILPDADPKHEPALEMHDELVQLVRKRVAVFPGGSRSFGGASRGRRPACLQSS